MCLGIPGKITAVFDDAGMRMAKADFGGVSRTICLAYVPEAHVEDYILVHAGFAISRLNEEEARQTLELLQELQEAETKQE
ncbi:MAG: HypC/HybG/HupF family hydrogenase formation chaperone [Candidatus Binatia bacterium]